MPPSPAHGLTQAGVAKKAVNQARRAPRQTEVTPQVTTVVSSENSYAAAPYPEHRLQNRVGPYDPEKRKKRGYVCTHIFLSPVHHLTPMPIRLFTGDKAMSLLSPRRIGEP